MLKEFSFENELGSVIFSFKYFLSIFQYKESSNFFVYKVLSQTTILEILSSCINHNTLSSLGVKRFSR